MYLISQLTDMLFFPWTKTLQQFMNAVKCSDISVQERLYLCNWEYREFINPRFSAETCLQSGVCELISLLQIARVSSQTSPKHLIRTLSSVGWAVSSCLSQGGRAFQQGRHSEMLQSVLGGEIQRESPVHRRDHHPSAPLVRQHPRIK